MVPLVRVHVQRHRPARVDVLNGVFPVQKMEGEILFWQHRQTKSLVKTKKEMLSLALAIVKHKRRTGKSVQAIVDGLLDIVDQEIIDSLADYGIDYYSYQLSTNTHYNLHTTCNIIKYFLPHTSAHHTHLAFIFLSRIKPPFTPFLQQFTLDCLTILQSTPKPTTKLLWFYHFLLKFNHTHVGRFCIYRAIHTNSPLLVLFYLKVLTKINYSPHQVKSMLLSHNNPIILHISMNFC